MTMQAGNGRCTETGSTIKGRKRIAPTERRDPVCMPNVTALLFFYTVLLTFWVVAP